MRCLFVGFFGNYYLIKLKICLRLSLFLAIDIINLLPFQKNIASSRANIACRSRYILLLISHSLFPTVTQQLYPTIEQCHEESTMCYSVDYPPSLNCIIRNVRPEALLTWSQRMVDYDSQLISELIVTPGKQNTFTSHASVNLTKNKPLLSIYTCKLTRQVFHVAEYEAFIIVENTKLNLHRQPIKFNAELHSTLVLPCTAFKAEVIVWKRSVDAGTAPQVIIISVKNWKDDRNITYNEDFTLGTDGSLILERTDWHHSGIYTCVATNHTLSDVQIIDVMIFGGYLSLWQ